MRLYIIRHADPDYPNDTITPRGHEEAKALAVRLKAEGINKIYSSPVQRAIHTMQYTAELTGLPYEILDWTHELMGLACITDTSVLDPEMVEQFRNEIRWPLSEDTMARRHEYYSKLGNPQNVWNLDGRIIRDNMRAVIDGTWDDISLFRGLQIDKILKYIQEGSDQLFKKHGYERDGYHYKIVDKNEDKIAVFCHEAFGITWTSLLLSIPVPLLWAAMWIPPSSVTTILLDQRNDEWACTRALAIGDTSHLYANNMEPLPRGIINNYH